MEPDMVRFYFYVLSYILPVLLNLQYLSFYVKGFFKDLL